MSATMLLATAKDEKCSNWASCAIDKGKDVIGGVVNGTKDAINTANDVGNFLSDPWGNTYKALRDSAKNLSENVLPALTHATMPDLTLDWFTKAYAMTFAMAIFIFVVLLIPQFVNVARGRMSGADLVETLTLYGPLFFIGSMFGPAVGAFLTSFFSALSDSIIRTMLSTSLETMVDNMGKIIGTGDGDKIVGGAVFGSILMAGMVLGLGLAFIVLIVQLITLYFAGVLFPLGWVWVVDKKKRSFGSKIPFVWLGILASHPLLFLLLGLAFLIASANLAVFAESVSLQNTVNLVVAVLALLIASLSPLLLFKFAPVLPMGGGSADGGPSIGANSPQEADQKYDTPVTDSSGGGGSSSSSDAGSSTGSGSSTGTGSSTSGSGGSGNGSKSGTAGAEEEAAGSSIKEAAAAGGKASAGAGSSAGAGATAGAASAEGGAMAAGAAESSTGVGAAVGIPTMIAAGAKAAADKANDVATSSADMASAPVDDAEEQYGRNSTNE